MVRIPARLLALLPLLGLSLSALAQSTTSNGAAAAAGCGGLIGGLIGLAISIAIAYYLYTDSKKRGMDNSVLWALLGFFTGFIGLIIYLLMRKK